ncbi:MAG TPA: hypothetical protein VGP18_00655 [Solirubrobacteraceae bacterium]|nr:hypothetical protein [Solirubrobacteraceae bacterium]
MPRVRLTVDRGPYCSEIPADSDELTVTSRVIAGKGSRVVAGGAVAGEGACAVAEGGTGVVAGGGVDR